MNSLKIVFELLLLFFKRWFDPEYNWLMMVLCVLITN